MTNANKLQVFTDDKGVITGMAATFGNPSASIVPMVGTNDHLAQITSGAAVGMIAKPAPNGGHTYDHAPVIRYEISATEFKLRFPDTVRAELDNIATLGESKELTSFYKLIDSAGVVDLRLPQAAAGVTMALNLVANKVEPNLTDADIILIRNTVLFTGE